MPLVLLLGLEGSAKTTTVIKSGLDPELLAGEVFRGDAVTPTRSLNAWISQGTVFVEAGGRLTSDEGRWGRLIQHLLPDRLRAALSSGMQAPRLAVVCMSCDDLLRPDAADKLPAAGRGIRSRLSEVAQRLGIRLPVYVIFTKADRIPHFPDYVRNFTREEVRDVLGATIPLGRVAASSYSEKAYKEIEAELQRIFLSLAAKRLKFLPRENQTDIAAVLMSSRESSASSFRSPPSFSWSCVVRASSRSAHSSGVSTLSAYGRSWQANRLTKRLLPPP